MMAVVWRVSPDSTANNSGGGVFLRFMGRKTWMTIAEAALARVSIFRIQGILFLTSPVRGF
jgi:hypothetical protein